MKKILFLIIFFICFYSYTQEYNLKITNFDFNSYVSHPKGMCGSTQMSLNIYLENGNRHTIISNGGHSHYQDLLLNQSYNSPVKTITFYSLIHSRTTFGCNGGTAVISREISLNKCGKGNYTDSNSDSNWTQVARVNASFNYEISPVITLIEPNSINTNVGYETPFELKVNTDKFDNSYYRYQYQVLDTRTTTLQEHLWKELPSEYQQKKSPKIQLNSFLAENVTGKYIFFRTKSACDGSYASEPIWYQIKKSLPLVITPNNQIIVTNCPGEKNNYSLQFNRSLKSDELLNFTISPNTVTTQSFTNISTLDTDNKFTFYNLPAGIYNVKIIGKNQDYYSEYSDKNFTFTIKNPDPIEFEITDKKAPFCYGGADGQATIKVKSRSLGDNDGYQFKLNDNDWKPFSSNLEHTIIGGLPAGITHSILVKDKNGCIAEIKSTHSFAFTEKTPLSITYPSHSEPTFFGATNGKIVAKITGGTPLADNSYQFEWKNTQNQVVGTTQTTFSAGAFYITLSNIPADTYFLTIRDKNHALATDKTGCTIINSEFILKQPTPLKADIQLIRPISCHSENEFGNERDQNSDGQRDESQDGILKIIASGGVPFTSGNPYKYVWKKQKADGSWAVLPFEEDTARGLSDGNYAINIEDANGIILGQYNLTTNALQKATDVVYRFSQPEKLTLSFEKTDASCRGNDGSLLVTAQGGTPPYRYQWSNGETSPSIQNLLPLPYFVIITDSRGCKVEGNITINQPNALKITENITPLLCHNATDASIEVSVEGGTLPYTYQWSNGANTSRVNNLSSGSYELKITDGQGCSYFKHFTIENPPKFEINIGEDRTLCNEQTYEIDTKINDPQAQYQWYWNNQLLSNNSKIIISRSGTYKAIVRTKNGCEATDEISITTTTAAISAEFLLTTQAYENQEVILVNTSTPKGESTQWIVPNHSLVEVTNQDDDYISLIFKEKGEYQIGIKQTQGECFEVFYKTILVEENNGFFNEKSVNQAFVKEFSVAPNPNNGHFKAKVILEKATPLNFRLYNIAGELMLSQKAVSNTEHWVDFQTQLAAGTYILVLETPYQQISKKIIIH